MEYRKKQLQGTLIFLISILQCIYWLFGNYIPLYKYAIVGAIFEILWLPMVVLIIGLPILTSIFWVKQRCKIKSFYLYALILSSLTLAFQILHK